DSGGTGIEEVVLGSPSPDAVSVRLKAGKSKRDVLALQPASASATPPAATTPQAPLPKRNQNAACRIPLPAPTRYPSGRVKRETGKQAANSRFARCRKTNRGIRA